MEIGSSTPNLQSTDAQVPYSWSSVFTDAEPMDLEGQLYCLMLYKGLRLFWRFVSSGVLEPILWILRDDCIALFITILEAFSPLNAITFL